MGCAQQEQVSGIAPQFQKARGRQGAIFQRLIIRPDPEKRFALGGLDGKTGGEAAGTPVIGKDFVHDTRPEASAQHGVGSRNPQRNGGPVGGEAVAREEMAQISQFFTFVHVMF